MKVLITAMLTILLTPPAAWSADTPDPEFDARELRAHIGFLADDLLEGRGAGTPGYDVAARYVAAWFDHFGLEPAGDGDSFLQVFGVVEEQLVPDSAFMSISRDGASRELESPGDYMIGGSYVDSVNDVRAPVTFVGFGVRAPEMDYDDLAGLDLDGRVVLMFAGAPAHFPHDIRAYYSSGRTKFRTLADLGVVGAIVISTREMAEKYSWDDMVRSYGFPGMRWVSPDGEVQGVYPGLQFVAPLSPEGLGKLLSGSGISPDALYESAESSAPSGQPLGLEIVVRRRSTQTMGTTSNVAAILPGADPDLKHEYVVITAHLDHIGVGPPLDGDRIYNGAYDNATGIAILLEVARALAEATPRPDRSVMFLAVGGEEQGLLGSDYFANFPSVPIEDIVANVNLDMPLFLYPLADVIAFGAEHSGLEKHVEHAAARAGLRVSPDPMPEEVLFIRSDQYSFVKKGVPAVFFVPGFQSADPSLDAGHLFTSFLQTHYHKPSDELDLPFDGPSAVAFTLANYHLIRSVADAPERPTWNPGNFFGEKFGTPAGPGESQ